jgi:hypothetical protein
MAMMTTTTTEAKAPFLEQLQQYLAFKDSTMTTCP